MGISRSTIFKIQNMPIEVLHIISFKKEGEERFGASLYGLDGHERPLELFSLDNLYDTEEDAKEAVSFVKEQLRDLPSPFSSEFDFYLEHVPNWIEVPSSSEHLRKLRGEKR